MKKKLILKNFLPPGDQIMLTAAVRDLHLCNPGKFLTDVRTNCPELWEHNPHLTRLADNAPQVDSFVCHYPLIDRSNEAPYHCIHGFTEFLNDRLGLKTRPTAFRGDLHLSRREKSWRSQVHELTGRNLPFWIVAAGGKFDYTIKWWDTRRYQQVVDHFRGRIQFVQVGEAGHHHPKLEGVIDLRGRTDLRQLIRLVYHAQGVLCGVTSLMHFAAAVNTRPDHPPHRACVVIGGGREPAHWEAYPFHQFIHTIGALPCCQHGGCWRARTRALGDGAEQDSPDNLCLDVAGSLPRCMDMISAAEVIRRIETYFGGGSLPYLDAPRAGAARRGVARSLNNPAFDEAPNLLTVRTSLAQAIKKIPPCPKHFLGRGIVICGGGHEDLRHAQGTVRQLRRLGCVLPVQLWFLGPAPARIQVRLAARQAGYINAMSVSRENPATVAEGWELKPHALLHAPFREVLLLEAGNRPLANPDALFDSSTFQKSGAVFWPDAAPCATDPALWHRCGLVRPGEPAFDTGQVLLDKARCWRALQLCRWLNSHPRFFHFYTDGEKGTFQFAFHKMKKTFAMPPRPRGKKFQAGFDARPLFQRRPDA